LLNFNLIITEVQLHISSSSAACEKQFKYSVFFRAEILVIKIVSICPGCTSKPHKYLIYNDISLLSLVHGAMRHSTTIAMLNWNRSHIGVVSIVYDSWKWFLNRAKFENITLTKKFAQFEYLSNGISFTSFRLVV
jgi:hypothetical protein